MTAKDNFILSRNTINIFTLSVLTLLIILEFLNFLNILDWGNVFLYITFPTLIVTLVIANLLNRFNKQRAAIHIILTVSFVFSIGTLLFNVHDLYSAIFVVIFISLYPFIISFALKPFAGVLCGFGEIIFLFVVVVYKEQLFGQFTKIELAHVFDMIFVTPAIIIACISFFSFYFGNSYIRSITSISNSEQNILNIVNSMIDSLFIMDHKMKITNVNASFLKLSGYAHEELIHNSPDTLFKNLISQSEIKRFMKDGKVQNLEKVITTKGGESIPVLFSCSKISHKNSLTPIYVCTLQNIREQVFLREAYRQSEKWLRSIYNNAANLIIAIDRTGHIVTCNTQIENYLGYKKEEIYDFPMEKIVHPDFHDKLQSMLKEIFNTGYSYDDEISMIKKDGSEISVRMHSSALKNEQGEYIHTISIMSDITEQKKREQMILELNSLVNAIRNIDQAITHESNMKILAQKCCDILITIKGYVHVSIYLLNRETKMIEPVATSGKHNHVSCSMSLDGSGNAPSCLQEVIKTGEWRLSYPREEECHECIKCRCKDCQNIVIFPILHNKQLYGVLSRCMIDVPISLENDIDLMGEIADDLGFAYVKYEADLVVRQSQERYRRIIDNMSSGLAVYKAIDDGEDFIFVDFNRAGETIDAIKKEMVIGRKVTEVFPDVKDFGVYAALQQVWRTGKSVYLPITLYHDERIQGWRENFIYKLETGEIIALYNDVTEKKKAEERELLQQKQLIESNKLASLGTLVSGIAHEINNPNTFIMLNIAVLKEIFDSTDHIIREYMNIPGNELLDNLTYDELKKQIRQLTSGITEGSERIKVIVKELRTYSGRDLDLEYKKFDINKSILSSTILVSGLLKKTTHNFTIELQEIPNIMGNEKQIEQVVINLLQNACGALENPDQGISVESVYQAETDEVFVIITDKGKGIEGDKLEKIFDPFYTTKRDSGGIGLGLSICQKIIKNHNAAISFESEVNKGTKVLLRFPVAHD